MDINTEVLPLAWPVKKACKRAGFGETKFRELIKAGEIGVIKVGDLTLVEDDEIRRWLESRRQRAA